MKALPPYRSEEEKSKLAEQDRVRTEQNKKDRKRRLEKLQKNWSNARSEPIVAIVQSTKNSIRDTPNTLVRQDKIILGIEDIVGEMVEKNQIELSSQNNIELSNVGLEDLSLIYQNRIEILSETIFDLETEKSIIQKRLKKLNRVSSKFAIERKLIEGLNIEEQNLLHQNEELLLQVDGLGYSYDADLPFPSWILGFLGIITGRPNEMVANKNISIYRYKIQNRSQQFLEIDRQLSDFILAEFYYNNLFETLKNNIEEYRLLRVEIGNEFTTKRNLLKNSQIKINRQELLKSFAKNIEDINKVNHDFNNAMLDSQKRINQKINEFEKKSKI